MTSDITEKTSAPAVSEFLARQVVPLEQLADDGTLSVPAEQLLRAATVGGCNLLVTGAAGSGREILARSLAEEAHTSIPYRHTWVFSSPSRSDGGRGDGDLIVDMDGNLVHSWNITAEGIIADSVLDIIAGKPPPERYFACDLPDNAYWPLCIAVRQGSLLGNIVELQEETPAGALEYLHRSIKNTQPVEEEWSTTGDISAFIREIIADSFDLLAYMKPDGKKPVLDQLIAIDTISADGEIDSYHLLKPDGSLAQPRPESKLADKLSIGGWSFWEEPGYEPPD